MVVLSAFDLCPESFWLYYKLSRPIYRPIFSIYVCDIQYENSFFKDYAEKGAWGTFWLLNSWWQKLKPVN